MAAVASGRERDGVRAAHLEGADTPVFGREQIAQIQRARILAGMFDVVCERDAASVTVADVVARSGVSRRTFYELFRDRDECFLAAFEDALSLAAASVLPLVRAEDGWLERLRSGVFAFLVFLDREPKLGHLLVCGSLSGGGGVLERRRRVIGQVARFVDQGREQSKLGQGPSLLYAEGAVGGVLSVLQNRLTDGHDEPLVALTGSFVSMLVMPYLGQRVARRELERALPSMQAPVPSSSYVDPFKPAGMRLTYRTIRVLLSVAENPGLSNRQVADLAEIRDQGQVSKLLRRLQRLGLIENANGNIVPAGEPNTWTLTTTGHQTHQAITQQTNRPENTLAAHRIDHNNKNKHDRKKGAA